MQLVPLAQLVTLDDDESFLYKKNLQNTQEDLLENILTDENVLNEGWLVFFIKIGLLDKKMDKKLKQHPNLWNKAWQNLGYQRYQQEYPIHPVIDSYTLLKGDYLFSLYSQKRSSVNEKQSISYLHHAAQFDYFPAIEELCLNYLTPGREYSFFISPIGTALYFSCQAIEKYSALGHILLCRVANLIATCLNQRQLDKKLGYYTIAYKALESFENSYPASIEHIQIGLNFRELSDYLPGINDTNTARQIIKDNMRTSITNFSQIQHLESQHVRFFASSAVETETLIQKYLKCGLDTLVNPIKQRM